MLHSLPDFSHSLCYPQSNWAPAVLVPEWVGLCMPQASVDLSNDPSREAGSLSCCPPAPTATGVFNQRSEALFPRAGAPGCEVCFAPRCLSGLSVRECGAAGSARGQTACPVGPTLRQSGSCHGNVSPLRPGACLSPSYRSGCMFLFYLVVVRLPCRVIFCQFWLCEEAQCVYLCRHLGSLPMCQSLCQYHTLLFTCLQ